jgi:aspartyl/asparaginyl beta-hydroxylase (cupin superfamily)
MIPCVAGGMIAVMDGPITIPPHRAEHNLYLRYHLTLEGTSTLDTEYMTHEHKVGEDFVFDHSRYHKVEKTTDDRRIVVILDIKRF